MFSLWLLGRNVVDRATVAAVESGWGVGHAGKSSTLLPTALT